MTTQTIEAPIETAPTHSPEPIEQLKPMKLSEAMRLGSYGTEQAIGSWHQTDADADGNPVHHMCAISTAWYALTGHKGHAGSGTSLTTLLGGAQVMHPVIGVPSVLDATIMDLNDTHKWSRQQIADWLEGLGL